MTETATLISRYLDATPKQHVLINNDKHENFDLPKNDHITELLH